MWWFGLYFMLRICFRFSQQNHTIIRRIRRISEEIKQLICNEMRILIISVHSPDDNKLFFRQKIYIFVELKSPIL